MQRNDLNHPKPNDRQTPIEKAYSLAVHRAIAENRSYFGDLVRENLSNYLSSGSTPEQAVEKLFSRAPGRR